MFLAYNGVLRKLGKEMHARDASQRPSADGATPPPSPPVQPPPPSAEQTDANTYTTTLHALNSAVLKLSVLTTSQKVYRGISGKRLPPQMLEPDAFNVRAGVEVPSYMRTLAHADSTET
jgi:hypothetical protein